MLSQTRYTEFGEVRTDVGYISHADFGYTFQRNRAGMGLMDYKARFYSSLLGRFRDLCVPERSLREGIQPDSLVPGAGNPQALNRYAYSNNNPINFTDPSGHKACSNWDENGNCEVEKGWRSKPNSIKKTITSRIITPTQNYLPLLPNIEPPRPWYHPTLSIPDNKNNQTEIPQFNALEPTPNPSAFLEGETDEGHANMIGISVSGNPPGSENSLSVELLFGDVNAIYTSGSYGAAMGTNVNAAIYIGEVFNIDNAEEYLNISTIRGVTAAFGLFGVIGGYGKAEYSGGPEVLYLGWAPGAGLSYWESNSLNSGFYDFGG